MDRLEKRTPVHHSCQAADHEGEIKSETLRFQLLNLFLHNLPCLWPLPSNMSKSEIGIGELRAKAINTVKHIDSLVDVGGRWDNFVPWNSRVLDIGRIIRLPEKEAACGIPVI